MKFRLSEGNGECFYYVGASSRTPLTGLPRFLLLSCMI